MAENDNTREGKHKLLTRGSRFVIGAAAVIAVCADVIAVAKSQSALQDPFSGKMFFLYLPLLGSLVLIYAAATKRDSCALALSVFVGVFPLAASPLNLIFEPVLLLMILMSKPASPVLLAAGLWAAVTAKERTPAFVLFFAGLFFGGLLGVTSSTAYVISWRAQKSDSTRQFTAKRDADLNRKPNLQEVLLTYRVLPCVERFAKDNNGLMPETLAEIGPDGTGCLSESEVSGKSAGVTLHYRQDVGNHQYYNLSDVRADGNTVHLLRWLENDRYRSEAELAELAACIKKSGTAAFEVISVDGPQQKCRLPVNWKRTSPTSFTAEGPELEEQRYDVKFQSGQTPYDFVIEMRPNEYGKTGLYSLKVRPDGRVYRTDENRPAADSDPFFRLP